MVVPCDKLRPCMVVGSPLWPTHAPNEDAMLQVKSLQACHVQVNMTRERAWPCASMVSAGACADAACFGCKMKAVLAVCNMMCCMHFAACNGSYIQVPYRYKIKIAAKDGGVQVDASLLTWMCYATE